jgi:hypothetical protein
MRDDRRLRSVANAALTTYMVAVALDFWPIMRRQVSPLHLLWPAPMAELVDAIGGGNLDSRALLLPPAFLLGLVLSPVLRRELSLLRAAGETRPQMLRAGLFYVAAVVWGLNVIVAAWRFLTHGSVSSLPTRVLLAAGSSLLGSVLSLAIFSPMVITAVLMITWFNRVDTSAGSDTS